MQANTNTDLALSLRLIFARACQQMTAVVAPVMTAVKTIRTF